MKHETRTEPRTWLLPRPRMHGKRQFQIETLASSVLGGQRIAALEPGADDETRAAAHSADVIVLGLDAERTVADAYDLARERPEAGLA